jgi:hypothetical protein
MAMRRPYYFTFSRRLPNGWRTPTYATEESAVRHAEELCRAFPLVVVSIHDRSRESLNFVRAVAHPEYREHLARERAELAQAAAGEGGAS